MFRICLDTAFIQEGVKRIDTGDAEISKKHDHRFDEDWYVDLIFKSTTADDANGIKDQKAAAAVAAAAVLPESNEETRGNTNDGKGEKPIQRLQQQEKDIKDELQSSSSADATILLPNHWSDNILLEPTKRLQEEYMLLRAEIPPDEDCVIGATPAAAADATTSSNRMSGQGDKDTFSIEKKGENRIISSPSSRASEKLLSDIDKDLENLRALHSGSISPAKDGIDTSQTLDSSLDSEFLAGIRKGADPKDIFLEDDMDDDELLKQLQAELEDSSM